MKHRRGRQLRAHRRSRGAAGRRAHGPL